MGELSEPLVVVTGDVTMDWNLATFRSTRNDEAVHTWWNDDHIRVCWQRGGAALLADLIQAVGRRAGFGVCQMGAPQEVIHVGDDSYHHAYAMWAPHPYAEGKGSSDRANAWRVKEFLGLERRLTSEPAGWQKVVDDPANPALVVVDDAALGFRDQPVLWPQAISNPTCPAWILLKMARPVAQGPLWEHLRTHCASRLIVAMTVNDLRLSQIQVSRQLSWERTAQDLFWEIANNPQVNALSRCARVIISFDTAGALLLTHQQDGALECRLFFDPKTMEGLWAPRHPGRMIGYTSCLATGIAHEVIRAPAEPDLAQAIQSGVAAMRLLHQIGYDGPNNASGNGQLAFPLTQVVDRLLQDDQQGPLAEVSVQDPVHFLDSQGKPAAGQSRNGWWTILQERYPVTLDQLARRIVEEGADAVFKDVPIGRFSKLLTVDRHEIESYRSISAVLGEYCSAPQDRPISIAVFGPPGSGKSFGVAQVADSIRPNAIKSLTFNLSQLHDPDELGGALHQVRDVGLSGKIPLVFWDEFDSRLGQEDYGWLRYFLAPMQDGTFQEGQITHPIGQAIFVFAGGTCRTMEEFGRAVSSERLRAAKGRDFASRLKGFVNVMGPDPRDPKHPAGDPHYLIRRAILLRSLFERKAGHLFAGGNGKGQLRIDPGVLRAFLHITQYRHGVRSMESIIAMSVLAGRDRFERSCLPAEAQLNLHVNGLEFLALVQQPEFEDEPMTAGDPVPSPMSLLGKMAAEVHEVYRESQENNPAAPASAHKPYADLGPEDQRQCRANVRDIRYKLSTIGYVMIPARSNTPPFGFPGAALEALAEAEHERWLRAKAADGWRYGPERDDVAKLNPAMVPWEKLSDEAWARLEPAALREAMWNETLPDDIRETDRALIRAIPRILAKGGFTVVKLESEEKDTP